MNGKTMNDFDAIGTFGVRQSVVNGRDELLSAYDLVFAVLSWETRCTAAAKLLKGRGQKVKVLHFVSLDTTLERLKEKNLAIIKGELGDDFGEVLLFDSSVRQDKNFPLIFKLLEDAAVRAKRPLHVLFDMTCFPKRYLLYFLGVCFQTEFAVSLDYLYSEGRYLPGAQLEGLAEVKRLVSEGEWQMLQVPYFESREFGSDSDHDLFISAGLEMHSIAEYVNTNEPRNVVVYEVEDGNHRIDSVLLADARNRMKTLLDVPNVSTKQFKLVDIIGLARDAMAAVRKTTCLAIGSKPHALALGLAALSNKNLEITCRVPVGYSGNDIPAIGTIQRFEIRDRFNPSVYRTLK